MTIPSSAQHPPAINRQTLYNFTMTSEIIIRELGGHAALVHSFVWRYCQMADGICRAAVSSIARRVNLDNTTVTKYLQQLTQAGYLRDLTPGVRYRPHIYRDTGKAFAGPQQHLISMEDLSAEDLNSSTENLSTENFDTSTENLDTSTENLRLKKVLRKNQEREEESIRTIAPRVAQSPELALFREAADFQPPKQIFDDIIAAVQAVGRRLGREPTPDDLKPYVKAWAGRGFKPANLAWLFDWAVNGTIPERTQTYGNQRPASISQQERNLEPPTPEQLAAYARVNARRAAKAALRNLRQNGLAEGGA